MELHSESGRELDMPKVTAKCPLCHKKCTGKIITMPCKKCGIFFVPRLISKKQQIKQSKYLLERMKI